MLMLRTARLATAICLLAAAACRAPLPQSATPRSAAPPTAGSVLYSVDSAASRVVVLVYRDGPLAALGHNHVISVPDLRGRVQLHRQLSQSSFELQFDAGALTVDDPALRGAEGSDFDSVISDAQRTGTRSNMLGERGLDASRNATITLQSGPISMTATGFTALTRITVRGRESLVEVPVGLQQDADQLVASGEFRLRQTELGLTPFSVMLGAMRVADEIRVRYRIVARRVSLPAAVPQPAG